MKVFINCLHKVDNAVLHIYVSPIGDHPEQHILGFGMEFPSSSNYASPFSQYVTIPKIRAHYNGHNIHVTKLRQNLIKNYIVHGTYKH